MLAALVPSRLRTLARYRELMITLTIYDVRARYKQSVLGAGWAIAQPIVTMVVFTMVFSGFARIQTGGIPYPIFSFSALVFWTFFATSLGKATQSLVANASLIRKIYFPREIFPIVVILGSLFDCAVAFVILLAMMLWFHVVPTLHIFWVVPLLLLQILFLLAVSLTTSMLHAKFRDVGNAIGLMIQMWMFISPVAYPVSLVPAQYRALYMLNPMAALIQAYRDVLIMGVPPESRDMSVAAGVILVLLLASYRFFLHQETTIVDVI